MTPERIAELRALATYAVPGPWRVGEGPSWDDVMAGDGDDAGFVAYSARGNAPFIAAARTALPEALDEIERLKVHELATAGIKRMIESYEFGFTIHQEGALRVWLAGTKR